MVEPDDFIAKRSTTYSHVYLEYEPSPNLNESLRQFIRPELRSLRQFAQIALRSESFLQAPIVTGGRALEHPPDLMKHLHTYQGKLDFIKTHQLRLASYVEMQTRSDESLSIHFEVLPNEFERRHLGRLALKDGVQDPSTIGVVAHIPAGAAEDPYGQASARLRSIFAVSHPSMQGRQHTTPAPLSLGLWVERPMLRDKYPSSNNLTHKDIIQNE
jgi:hypothetical protein